MFHILRRFTTAASLFGLFVAVVALMVGVPARSDAHHLCGNTGSPFGAFDLQTYEAGDYRSAYALTMDLAGHNRLFPERPSFAMPRLEIGGRAAGSGLLTDGYIPPVLLKSIAWIESGWSQASHNPPVPYGQIGPVLSSHDCGYGIMQVTSGMQNVTGLPTLDQAMIGGHYGFNIARGAKILAEKWNAAPEFRPVVGDRNIAVIEDWYYALWGYNGFAFKNHPMNPDFAWPRPMYDCSSARSFPYQELIMGCAANPPVRGGTRMWNPQPVSLPNLADPNFYDRMRLENWGPCSQQFHCAPMDIPRPSPAHQDYTLPAAPREHILGSPSIGLAPGSISLAAVPGGQSLAADLTVGNGGTGILSWRATSNASWLRTTRFQGVSLGGNLGGVSQTLRVSANAAGLTPGTYTGSILFESLYSQNTQAVVNVTLVVGLQDAAPHGGDFNGDGRSDLIFLCCSDYASLWTSNGAGGFSVSTFRPGPGYGMRVGSWITGDFNGDRKTDLLHLLTPSDYVHTWISNGDGTFSVGTFRAWAGYAMNNGAWQSGDFNGDGKTDLIHLTSADYANTWLSTGGHSFSVAFFRPGPGYGMQSGFWKRGDFNGDRRTDLIHVAGADYTHPWLSRGDGTFSVGFFQPGPGYGMRNGFWQEGDFNGDNRADLLHFAGRDYTHPWLSRGDGTFSVGFFQPGPGYGLQPGLWPAADLNADARTDLVHLTSADYTHPWLSTGDGKFNVAFFRAWSGYVIQTGLWQTGDFNGDGKGDLIHLAGNHANIWFSQGSGSFSISTFRP